MKLKFTLPITCKKGMEELDKCNDGIREKIENKYGKFLSDGKVCGHISIIHEQGNHTIFLFYYDKKGVHESEDSTTKETVTKTASDVIKYTGIKPTINEIKKLI